MKTPRRIYYTYIVHCADGTYYIGKTYDVEYRLKQHNGLISGGAKYTKGRKPITLVYSEQHETNKVACQREAYLKQLTRQQKEALINKKFTGTILP